MDRASVFGTDSPPAEATETQELTETGDSARSAGRSADSENPPAQAPVDGLADLAERLAKLSPEDRAAVADLLNRLSGEGGAK